MKEMRGSIPHAGHPAIHPLLTSFLMCRGALGWSLGERWRFVHPLALRAPDCQSHAFPLSPNSTLLPLPILHFLFFIYLFNNTLFTIYDFVQLQTLCKNSSCCEENGRETGIATIIERTVRVADPNTLIHFLTLDIWISPWSITITASMISLMACGPRYTAKKTKAPLKCMDAVHLLGHCYWRVFGGKKNLCGSCSTTWVQITYGFLIVENTKNTKILRVKATKK